MTDAAKLPFVFYAHTLLGGTLEDAWALIDRLDLPSDDLRRASKIVAQATAETAELAVGG